MIKPLLSFRTRLIIGFAVSVLLILVITIVSFKNVNELKREHASVNHTQGISKAATDLLQSVTDAETAARGYFGTGQELFIKIFEDGVIQIDATYGRLRDSVQNEPAQLNQVIELSAHIAQKKTAMSAYVQQRRERMGTSAVTLPLDRVLKGKVEMDLIRESIADIIKQEQTILARQQVASDVASGNVLMTITCGGLVFAVIIVKLFLYILKTFGQKEKAEQSVLAGKQALEETLLENKHQNWLMTGLKHLAEEMQGKKDIKELGETILRELIAYTGGHAGTIYLYDLATRSLNLCAVYAAGPFEALKQNILLSETWIGQAAVFRKPKMVNGKINPAVSVSSSVISKTSANCFVVPFLFENELAGVIDLAYDKEIGADQEEYILSTMGRIGITVHAMVARSRTEALYHEIQQQAEELMTQQEELRQANEELLERSKNSV